MAKSRKPRTTGSDLRFDKFGHQFGQEYDQSIATRKLECRLRSGKCLGCGVKPCSCRSKTPSGS